MTNCNTKTYAGSTAATDAAAFLATLEDTKFLGMTSWSDACSPTIIIVYKT